MRSQAIINIRALLSTNDAHKHASTFSNQSRRIIRFILSAGQKAPPTTVDKSKSGPTPCCSPAAANQSAGFQPRGAGLAAASARRTGRTSAFLWGASPATRGRAQKAGTGPEDRDSQSVKRMCPDGWVTQGSEVKRDECRYYRVY